MSDEIKYMAANATGEEVEAVYLHYDKLRLNERDLKAEIEQLQKQNEESFRKGFWAGYEDARCFPDENNILQRYTALTENRNNHE